MRHTTPEIVSLSKRLLEHGNTRLLSSVSLQRKSVQQMKARPKSTFWIKTDQNFAAIAVTLSQLGLTVVDAYISKASRGRYFDMFTVLDAGGTEVSEPVLREGIVAQVKATLANPDPRQAALPSGCHGNSKN